MRDTTQCARFGQLADSRSALLPEQLRRLDRRIGRRIDVRCVLLVVTDVFHQFGGWHQFGRVIEREWPRVGTGIVDQHGRVQMSEIRARESFDDVHLIAVNVTPVVEPRQVVESDGVDDERIRFPTSNRVPLPRELQVVARWMLPTIHEHLPISVDGFHQDEDIRWRLDDAERVGLRARRRDRKTPQLRIVLGLKQAHSLERLRTERQCLAFRQQVGDVHDAGAAQPDSTEGASSKSGRDPRTSAPGATAGGSKIEVPAETFIGDQGFDSVKLQGVFYRATKPLVLINGQTLGIGEIINGVEVIAIGPTNATLGFGKEQRVFNVK